MQPRSNFTHLKGCLKNHYLDSFFFLIWEIHLYSSAYCLSSLLYRKKKTHLHFQGSSPLRELEVYKGPYLLLLSLTVGTFILTSPKLFGNSFQSRIYSPLLWHSCCVAASQVTDAPHKPPADWALLCRNACNYSTMDRWGARSHRSRSCSPPHHLPLPIVPACRAARAVQGNGSGSRLHCSRVPTPRQGVCVPAGYTQGRAMMANRWRGFYETCFQAAALLEVTRIPQHNDGPAWHVILTGNIHWIQERLPYIQFNRLCCTAGYKTYIHQTSISSTSKT